MTPVTPATRKRRSTTAKGQTLQRLAKAILESRGWRVEPARKVVKWIPVKADDRMRIRIENPARPQRRALRPISVSEDLYSCFDGIGVRRYGAGHEGGREVMFYQVTVLEEVSRRRTKILASGFPVTGDDVILGYVGGPGRHFRVLRGPTFETATEECWRPVTDGKP